MNVILVIQKSIRGYVKPGHKYIRRTGTSGNYQYEYSDMDKKVKPIKRGENKVEDILRALSFLAGRCDGARSLDSKGFNKFDTKFGHDLASKSSLSESQKRAALNLLRKYKQQLIDGGIKLDFSEISESNDLDADADILLSKYNDKDYSILFDFKWNDPKWIAIKDGVKKAGAIYDGARKIWHISDENLPNLFDNIDNIAITDEAKRMIVNKDERLKKIENDKKKAEIEASKKAAKKYAEVEKAEIEELSHLKRRASIYEKEYKDALKRYPRNAKMAEMLWIDDSGKVHNEIRKRGVKPWKDQWLVPDFARQKMWVLENGRPPSYYALENLKREAKNMMIDLKSKESSKGLGLELFAKPIDMLNESDILSVLTYAKRVGIIREATRGSNKGKICIEKKLTDIWGSVNELDSKVRRIFSQILNFDGRYGNYHVFAPPKLKQYWFVGKNPKNGLAPDYAESQNYIAWKLHDLITDYNEGKASGAVKMILSGNADKDKGSIKEKLKEAKEKEAKLKKFKNMSLAALNKKEQHVFVPGLKPKYKLWKHQLKYLNWMLAAEKGIVGADTGLGKTLTTLAYLKKMKTDKKIDGGVLFLPGAVMYSWEPEMKQAFGKGKILYIDGTIKQKMAAVKRLKKEKFDLVICSHGLIGGGKDGTQYPILEKVLKYTPKYAIIYDEAHRGLLNPKNNAWKNFKTLVKDHRYKFLLTATPSRNNILDTKHLIDLLHPGAMGSSVNFISTYGQKINNIIVPKDGEKFWDDMKPFCPVMSKYSPDVDVKLPKAVFTTESLIANDDQEKYVEAARDAAINALLAVENPDNMTRSESAHIFKILGDERRAAFDPRMINKSYNGSTAMIDRTIELLQDKMYAESLGNKKPSSSLIVSSFVEPFPVYKKMMMERLGLKDNEIALITGAVDKKKRPEIEQAVTSGKVKVVLMGIGAGGVGLNFQKGADTVFVISDPWTYADKKQAVDRIVRPGAKSDRVYITDFKFISKGQNKSASSGISEFVRNKIKIKREMHESADVEALIRKIGETCKFDDYLKALGLTRQQYDKMRKQKGKSITVSKSLKFIIRQR